MQGGIVVGFSFLIELSFLEGLKRLEQYNAKVVTLLKY
jgi:adenine/guanine phosphoribosyltransferase-like PRPP-binding protein